MRWRAPRSLFGQFVALHIVAAAALALALTLGASALLHGTADHFQRDLLRQQAERVAGGGAAPGLLAVGMAFAVVSSDRVVHRRQGPMARRLIVDAPLDAAPRFFRHGPVRGLSLPDRGRWIVVAQDSTAPEVVTDDIVRAFLKRFALLSLPIAALLPLIGALLTRRLTRRMEAVSAIATRIGPRTLDLRLPVRPLPLEVAPLATATNAALDRLAEGFRVQAAFAADVAHELRTPLAVIRLRADAVPDPDVRAAMLASVDRAARVIGQLLSLADLEQRIEDTRRPIALTALAEDVVGDRAPAIVAGGRSIALEVIEEPPVIAGYPAPLILAIENLVDNAARHTPTGTAIVVQVGPGATLSVVDDGGGRGRGIADADLARLTARFWRADGTHVEGSGIGLSIVDRVARAHHGALRITRAGKGLRFTLEFSED